MPETELQRLLITWLPAALLLVLGLWLLWPTLCRRRRERQLQALLRNLGPEVRSDIILEDGLDGLAFLEHAVLTPDGVAVVGTHRREGAIFGAEQSDQWVEVIGHRTIRFPNPLTAVRDQVNAVRFNRPKLPARGLVLFTGKCSFPKGKPEGVVLPGELVTDQPPDAAPATLKRGWDDFLELAEQNTGTYGRDLARVKEKRRYGRPVLGGALLTSAFAWVGIALAALG